MKGKGKAKGKGKELPVSPMAVLPKALPGPQTMAPGQTAASFLLKQDAAGRPLLPQQPANFLEQFARWQEDIVHKPIHFPGGDPLAAASAAAAAAALMASKSNAMAIPPEAAAALAAMDKKKKRKKDDEVMGLAPMVRGQEIKPGKVVVLQKDLRKDLKKSKREQREASGYGSSGINFMSGIDPNDVDSLAAAARSAITSYAAAPPQVPEEEVPAAPAAPALGEWVCEVCMRKFGSQDALQKHEQFSDLHRANMAKLEGDAWDGEDADGEELYEP